MMIWTTPVIGMRDLWKEFMSKIHDPVVSCGYDWEYQFLPPDMI